MTKPQIKFKFEGNKAAESAFQGSKHATTQAPVLAIADER